jgi:hypothetical protein
MKVISERVVLITFYINVFYYFHWVDTSASGLLVPDSIIRPVVSALALTLFTRYIFFIKIYSSKSMKLLLKLRFSSLRNTCSYPIYAILFRPFRCPAHKDL